MMLKITLFGLLLCSAVSISEGNLLSILPFLMGNNNKPAPTPNQYYNQQPNYQSNNYGQQYNQQPPQPQSPQGYRQYQQQYNDVCAYLNPQTRLPCGNQGAYQQSCQAQGCCWDATTYQYNYPKCFTRTRVSQSPSQGRLTTPPTYTAPQRQSYVPSRQPYVPPQQPYVPPQQPYVPPQQPYVPPQQPYVPPQQPYVPSQQPYVPSQQPYVPSQQPYVPPQQPYVPPQQPYVPPKQPNLSPRPSVPTQNINECSVPKTGSVILCGREGISETECRAKGCCYGEVYGVKRCYLKEQQPSPAVPSFEAPTVIPKQPYFTTQPPTKKLNILKMLQDMEAELKAKNSGQTGGGSMLDMLKRLQNKDTPKSTQRPAYSVYPKTPVPPVTRPATRRPIPVYTTVPTPPPVTRWQCNLFGSQCRYVVVPTQPPPMCYPRECGTPKMTPDMFPDFDPKKIVGGTRSFPFTHPWTVMIEKIEGKKKYICGATLICHKWLITAAHCLDHQSSYKNTPDLDPNMYKIYVGRYTGWKIGHGRQVQVFKGIQGIERMMQHERFEPGTHRGVITHDIALIKLRTPVQMSQYVQAACLPTESAKPGETMYATGWGITHDTGPSDKTMKQVGAKIHSQQTCKNEVPGFNLPPGVICAGGEKGHDTCTGDSGGPLIGSKTPTGFSLFGAAKPKWYVYGLTSIGSPSCNTMRFDRQPAVYTDVFYFLKWIQYHTGHCCA